MEKKRRYSGTKILLGLVLVLLVSFSFFERDTSIYLENVDAQKLDGVVRQQSLCDLLEIVGINICPQLAPNCPSNAKMFETITCSISSNNNGDFDTEATVTFTNGGESHTTGMYYTGSGNGFEFRFTGTKMGSWSYTTNGPNGLGGHSGTIDIVKGDEGVYGFLEESSGCDNSDRDDTCKWVRPRIKSDGSTELIGTIPQYAMTASPNYFYNNPGRIDSQLDEFVDGHGFTGLHTPVWCRWFDKDRSSCGGVGSSANPDPRTFEALEDLIVETHKRGGITHIWMWGDSQDGHNRGNNQNDVAEKRLHRYIAARLGPLPGWTMSYGFDLFEWTSGSELTEWRNYMHQHFGWFHFLGARGNKNSLNQIDGTNSLDYKSIEWHKPDYNDYIDHMNSQTSKPIFSEDRFRMRNEGRSKDYNTQETRQGLWRSVMAGGVANIWGNLLGCNALDGAEPSCSYPNENEIKTYSVFWENRFLHDMERCQDLVSGNARCLRSGTNSYVIYQESSSSITADLSGMSGSRNVIAVNTKNSYSEQNLGSVEPGQRTFSLGSNSDWAIAIGDFGISAGGGSDGGGNDGGVDGGTSVSVCGNDVIETGEQCEVASDCSSGQNCAACQCVTPTGNCELTSARWSTTVASEGQRVELIVKGNDCNGENVVFSVFEDDIIAGENDGTDDDVLTNPIAVTFVGDTATGSWISEYQCDGEDPVTGSCTFGNPEYYFTASAGGSEIRSSSDSELVVSEATGDLLVVVNSPKNSVNDPTPVLDVSVNRAADLSYSLDNGNFISICDACTTGNVFLDLAEGIHNVKVTALDASGNTQTVISTFEVDFLGHYFDDFADDSQIASLDGAEFADGKVSYGVIESNSGADNSDLGGTDDTGGSGSDTAGGSDTSTGTGGVPGTDNLFIEAEDGFTIISGYEISSSAEKCNCGSPSGGACLKHGSGVDSGSASYQFSGAPGDYNFLVTYCDEIDDSESFKDMYTLFINDQQIDTWESDPSINARSWETRSTPVSLDVGDVIKLDTISHSDGPGGSPDTHARIDFVRITNDLLLQPDEILHEAEDLSFNQYESSDNCLCNSASGGRCARHTGTASTTGSLGLDFEGASGEYEVSVKYCDEDDDIPSDSYKLFINNQQKGSWNSDSGGSVGWKTETITTSINSGDRVNLEATSSPPTTARVDFISFKKIDGGSTGDSTGGTGVVGGIGKGNFVSKPIRTSNEIRRISSVNWNEEGTDSTNTIGIELSFNEGNSFVSVPKGGSIDVSGNSILYRVNFDTTDNVVSILDLDIKWEHVLVASQCGDGVLDNDESCDDGNLVDGDGCSSTCSIEQPSSSNGGGFWGVSTQVTSSQLTNGFTAKLEELQRVLFTIEGEDTFVGVRSVSGNTATIVIGGHGTFDLKVGESIKIDIDGDRQDDFEVRLDEINGGVASVAVKEISEEERAQSNGAGRIVLWIVIVIILLALGVGAWYYFVYMKKDQKGIGAKIQHQIRLR